MRKKSRLWSFSLWIFLVVGCGDSVSVNQIFTSSKDLDRDDVSLELATDHYNRGSYREALKILEDLNKQDPFNEEIANLMGFVYFASTGIDTFDMATNLDPSKISSASGGDTLGFLNLFNAFVNISTEDVTTKIGTVDNSNNAYFSSLPILLPNKPGLFSSTDSLRYTISTLNYLNSAMKVLCPFMVGDFFVDSEGKTVDTGAQGQTGGRYDCQKTPRTLTISTQLYFLYSLAHIIEASIFTNNGILYSPEASSSLGLLQNAKTNLVKRGDALANPTQYGIDVYLDAISKMQTHVDQIYDLSADSMLSQTVLNLKVAILAMKKIPNMPQAFIGGLEKALDALETGASQINTGSSDSDESTGLVGALKKQMGSSLLGTVNTSVATAISQSPENKSALCSSLTEILKGTDVTKTTSCN